MSTRLHRLAPALVLTLGVLTLGACTPSPSKLCDHMNEVVKKELGELPPEFASECIEEAERTKTKLQRKGPGEYRNFANCVMDATTLEAMDGCAD